MRRSMWFLFSSFVAAAGIVQAADSVSKPRPVPLTRPEMKELIEDMKARTPRIPLPPLTEEEKAQAAERGSRGGGYESRLRQLYMPGIDSRGTGGGAGRGETGRNNPGGNTAAGNNAAGAGRGGEFSRVNDPNMSLDYAFKVELFWIVSRTNNCQYCLGHQESKLLRAGLTEPQIAALDCDWSRFTPAEQAAFALARKLTHEPNLIGDADIDAVRKNFTDLQILEMAFSVAGNNSINRWKEGVGVPQSEGGGGGFGSRPAGQGEAAKQPREKHSYLTPTPDEFKGKITKVAPLAKGDSSEPSRLAVSSRPALEPRAEVEKALDAARKRTPRLPLVDEAKAREVLEGALPAGAVPQWIRLLANFPRDGKSRIQGLRMAEEKGDLTPKLKAQVAWIIARQDRAWYSAGQAQKKLRALGVSDDAIFQLDGDWSEFTPADRALFTVARKLADAPVVLTDEDVTSALKLTGPKEVVQVINFTTGQAFFNRVTEVAGLQIEP